MRDAVAREHVVARRVRVRPVDVAAVLLERELAEHHPTRRARRAPGLESELPQRQAPLHRFEPREADGLGLEGVVEALGRAPRRGDGFAASVGRGSKCWSMGLLLSQHGPREPLERAAWTLWLRRCCEPAPGRLASGNASQ